MPKVTAMTVQLQVADHTTMQSYAALPKQPTGAAILVLQEAFGITAHIRAVADRFAAQGYLAIAPELFHRTAPAGFVGPYADFNVVVPHYQAITLPSLTLDLNAAFAWLNSQSSVIKDQIGCIGFCMGGRSTFLANAVLPLKAAVSAYGGGIAPDLLPLAHKQSGPLLLAWGGLDTLIDHAQRIAVGAALAEAGKDYSEVLFATAGHGFFCPDRPAYHAAAARQGWSMIDAFFQMHLQDPILTRRATATTVAAIQPGVTEAAI